MDHDLEVWKLSHELVIKVYKLAEKFPRIEHYGLLSQVKRSASSIPSNIIEGQARQYKKEYVQFLYIAKGSLQETNYHLFLAKDLGYITQVEYDLLHQHCLRIKFMLIKLIQSIQR